MGKLVKIKKVFNKIIDPFIKFLVKFGVTPNVATTSALVFLGFTVKFILEKNTIMAGIFVFLTGIIDAIDGSIAKKVGSTKFGDFYDAFIDRLVDASFYIAIAYTYPEYIMLCFFAFAFSFMTSYIAARAEVWTIGIKVKYIGGIGSRAGRTAILIIAFLLDKLELGLYTIIFAASITMIIRAYITFKTLIKQ